MIRWLSNYNYDYAIAAIPVQLVLLLFYTIRRNLPVRQNRYFLFVMWSNLIMTLTDIAACEMNELWTVLPLWLCYGINIVYFLTFIIRGWGLFEYTAETTDFYQSVGRKHKEWHRARLMMAVPAALLCVMILSAPVTGMIFTFGPGGYQSTSLYRMIYASTYFYIGMSFLCLARCWSRTAKRIRLSILCFNLVLLAGTLARRSFENTLVTSYFSILTILIIYLSEQNPDLYRDKLTELFNHNAFDVIIKDCIKKNIPFHFMVVSITNYESARSIYSYFELGKSLKWVGGWLIDTMSSYHVFYFDNGNYLLMKQGDSSRDDKDAMLTMDSRFQVAWHFADLNLSLSLSTLLIPQRLIPADSRMIHNILRYAFRNVRNENNRGNFSYDERMQNELERQEAVETALANGIQENRIEAFFQPIYSTEEERVVGAEALARLHDPELGFIPPLEFIAVAERTGAIMEVGRQVFERVCHFIQTEKPEQLGLRFINVNLSPAQCMNEDLADELSDIARRYSVPMSMIDFEITESSMDDLPMLQKQMLRLKSSGAVLSLDDFGTGTSNLTRLMKLPIHVVKLDMDIVMSFFRDEVRLLPDLVRMFQNASMQIVVEGVETAEMKTTLAEMGCDYEQGYYFSKPIPAADFMDYLRSMQPPGIAVQDAAAVSEW